MNELTLGWWMIPAYLLPSVALWFSVSSAWEYDTEAAIANFCVCIALILLATLARALP